MANANNTVVLLGKLVNDPVFIKNKRGEEFSARFTLRVDHNYKNKDGFRGADFIPVHLDNKSRMEFAHMLRAKQAIVVTGGIKTESYKDASGNAVYTMFVAADNISWTYGNTKPEEKEQRKEKTEEPTLKENNDSFSVAIDLLPFL